jgi:hypothetical protein
MEALAPKMRKLQAPDSKPLPTDVLSDRTEVVDAPLDASLPATAQTAESLHSDAQDTYFEAREPAEFIFCIILAAAYAGLAKLCWEPLSSLHDLNSFACVEGLFVTFTVLSLVLGFRPYISPSSLQLSRHGIKYRGPYWSQRKTVNWEQIVRLYLSEDLIIVVFHPDEKRSVRLLMIQSSYLSDRKEIVDSFARYAVVKPFYLKNPDWYVKGILLVGYLAFICWVLFMLRPS